MASKEVSKRINELRNHNLSDEYRYKLLHGGDGNDAYKKVPDKWQKLINAPFEVSSKCCDVMKKKPAKQYMKETGRMPYLGTMAEESALRKNSWVRYGCNAFDLKGQPQSRPLSFWTEQDVLQYIKLYNLPYAPIYGDIVENGAQLDLFNKEVPQLSTTRAKRTGCMFCMFGMSQDGCPNRFQKMKETHPNQYNYCMKSVEEGGLGLAKVLDYIGEKY